MPRRKATLVGDIRLDFAELFSPVDKGASGNAAHRPRIVLIKREGAMPMLSENVQAMLASKLSPDERAMLEADLGRMAAAATPPVAPPAPVAPAPVPMQQQTPMAASEPQVKQGDEPEEKPMAKSTTGATDEARTALQKARDENTALQKRVATLEDATETTKWLEKARAEYPRGVPGMNHEALAAVLKSASKALPADQFKALEDGYKAASGMLAQSELLKEFGAAGDAPAEKSAAAELQKRGAELAASDGVTREVAEARLLKADRGLAKRVRLEERKNSGLEVVV